MPFPSIGAIPASGGTTFTVWALGHLTVSVDIEGLGERTLEPCLDGYFSLFIPDVGTGARYRFRIDSGELRPDLASRWQPEGSDGPSVVRDSRFDWSDAAWPGIDRFDQILYELHIGTFTLAGTWLAAIERLPHLRDLGVTVIQLMPVATFKGRFGWGYDTVLPYAPYHPYGTPDDMRAFIDRAHALGLGVILDVVYNHVGAGDHYRAYSAHYFTDHYGTEWGASFNFDDEGARAVRDFIVGNAVYWVRDFHLDGFRLDATQALFDASDEHIIAEIAREARAAAGARSLYIVAENQPEDRRLIEAPAKGGYGLDALANDDFHHSARVALTGHNDFYYRDYLGTPQELVSALKYGFLYQGQRSDMRDKTYGTYNLDTPSERFVHFLENHDQVANSARGFRLSTLGSPARVRALTALLLLGPETPCLFQGQEFGASNPFLYFLGLDGAEAESVAAGRRKSVTNFPSVADPVMQERLPDPSATETFEQSKLDWSEAESHAHLLALHRDLIAIRRRDEAFSQRTKRRIDGAVIGEAAFLIRYITETPEEGRLLLMNFGRDLQIGVIAEPLLAPPRDCKWIVDWSSEHPDYDGGGRRPTDTDHFWILPADTAMLMRGEKRP